MKTGIVGRGTIVLALAVAAGAGWTAAVQAQTHTFSFAYDQPTTTAYGVAGNIFDAKLKELSGGKMSINQRASSRPRSRSRTSSRRNSAPMP